MNPVSEAENDEFGEIRFKFGAGEIESMIESGDLARSDLCCISSWAQLLQCALHCLFV